MMIIFFKPLINENIKHKTSLQLDSLQMVCMNKR